MLSLLRLHQHLVHNLQLHLGHSQLPHLVAQVLVAVGHLVGGILLVPSLPLVHPHRQLLVQHQPQPLVNPLEGLGLQLLLLVREEVSFCICSNLHGQYTAVDRSKLLPVHKGVYQHCFLLSSD